MGNDRLAPRPRAAAPIRGLRAMRAIVVREVERSVRASAELVGAVVWPTLWLVIFAAGVEAVFGSLAAPAYDGAYKPYQEYVIPGLVGMALLFGAMRFSTRLVASRTEGETKILLTAPLPRPYLLFCELFASAIITLVQAYLFLLVAFAIGIVIPAIDVPWIGWLAAIPAVLLSGFMLAAVTMVVAVLLAKVRDYSTTMKFVVYPVLLLSPAFYPLWQFRDNGAEYLYVIASANPFSHAVELIRAAAYGGLDFTALAVVAGSALVGFVLATIAFDPRRRFGG